MWACRLIVSITTTIVTTLLVRVRWLKIVIEGTIRGNMSFFTACIAVERKRIWVEG